MGSGFGSYIQSMGKESELSVCCFGDKKGCLYHSFAQGFGKDWGL